MVSNRYKYIKSIFLPFQKSKKKTYLSEKKVEEILDFVFNVGESIGFIGVNISKNSTKNIQRKHKFDVWIAKEIKKDLNLLKKERELMLILDWAISVKSNLFNYDFNEAYDLQKQWHKELFKNQNVNSVVNKEVNKKRIIYYSEDKNYFIYLLNTNDLKEEGKKMSNCVGGNHYQQKLKSGQAFYLSLRDTKNNSHLTIEIDAKQKKVIQMLGKANTKPKLEYTEKVLEFVLYYTGFESLLKNKDLRIANVMNNF